MGGGYDSIGNVLRTMYLFEYNKFTKIASLNKARYITCCVYYKKLLIVLVVMEKKIV